MVATITPRNNATANLQAAEEPAAAVASTPPPAVPQLQPAPSSALDVLRQLLTLLPMGGLGIPSMNSQQAMTISSGSDPKAVQAYIDHNPGQAKMAVDRGGRAFLVFGTSTAANGEVMVETAATNNGTGGTQWTPLSTFDKTVSCLDPGTGAKGDKLTPLTGRGQGPLEGNVQGNQKYTFNAFYKDPATGQPMASLTDARGKNVNLTTSQLSHDFGYDNVQSLVHGALSPAAQSSFLIQPSGGADGDGFGVGVSTTAQDVSQWLQKGQFPALASAKGGKTYLVDGVHTDARGQTTVQVQDPTNASSGTFSVSLSEATHDFHFFDRGTGGIGTSFTAATSGNGLEKGQKYTYKGMSVGADGAAQADLTDSHNMPVSVPVSHFAQAFGQQGLQNLLDSARANPAVETGVPSSTTYGAVPNSELFAAHPNIDDIQQGDAEGDCYLLSSMAALQRQDPQALQKMIKPSTDGNPHDYDVQFYLPQDDGSFKPVTVTVNDQLAAGSTGTAGDKTPIDPATGKPQIGYALIEKAYAQFNNQYQTQSPNSGYNGIAGGQPAAALQYLTGKPQHLVFTQGASTNTLWQTLSQANTGAPVVAGSKQTNGPSDIIAPNLFYGHTYTVMGTYTDPTTHQQMIKLRNPWGADTDAEGENLPGTHGQFNVSLADFQKYFMYANAAGSENMGFNT